MVVTGFFCAVLALVISVPSVEQDQTLGERRPPLILAEEFTVMETKLSISYISLLLRDTFCIETQAVRRGIELFDTMAGY